jgi:pimeloyl-ACP methyl ester carboxylesterase
MYLLPGAFRPSNNEIWYYKKELEPLAKQFSSITCNVWIIHGNKDKFVPVGNAAYAKKCW